MSPTQRSLKYMRDRGYLCDVVERWIPGANVRKDLFGFIDILCIGGDKPIVGVQATSYSNISARVKKIMELDSLYHVERAGIVTVVHGWRKVKNRWQVKEVWI